MAARTTETTTKADAAFFLEILRGRATICKKKIVQNRNSKKMKFKGLIQNSERVNNICTYPHLLFELESSDYNETRNSAETILKRLDANGLVGKQGVLFQTRLKKEHLTDEGLTGPVCIYLTAANQNEAVDVTLRKGIVSNVYAYLEKRELRIYLNAQKASYFQRIVQCVEKM